MSVSSILALVVMVLIVLFCIHRIIVGRKKGQTDWLMIGLASLLVLQIIMILRA